MRITIGLLYFMILRQLMSSADGFIRPEDARRILGVTDETLRSWAREGKIEYIRTTGRHRRYKLPNQEKEQKDPVRRKICYARVSSYSQKQDLERQIATLKMQFPSHDVISDIGIDLNFKRKGLRAVLELALRGQL